MVFATVLPVSVDEDSVAMAPTRIRPNIQKQGHQLKEGDFFALSKKAIQGPLEDPKPAKPSTKAELEPQEPVVARVALDATLIGTLVDYQQDLARAWIEVKGKRQMVRIGDVLEGHPGDPRVEAIADQSVLINLAGRTIALTPPDATPWERPGTSGER